MLLRSLLAALLALGNVCARAETIRFPGGNTPDDKRWDFVISVLELALNKAPDPVQGHDTIVRQPTQVQKRRIAELSASNLDVAVALGSRELQTRHLYVIPVPLMRGLFGWRLLLVNPESAEKFKSITRREQLRPMKLGFSRTFADWPIMEANGLTLVPADEYSTLIKMLVQKRMDYLSRHIGEVYGEYDAQFRRNERTVAIEPHLALHYKADWFFVVSPSKPLLASRIERGLKTAIDDGSYDKLFRDYFGPLLERACLEQRTVIELDNPDPFISEIGVPDEWWWQPRDRSKGCSR